MTTTTKTAHDDQVRAAANHARRTITNLGTLSGSRPVDGCTVPWVRQAVAAFLRGMRQQPQFCPHVGVDKAPTVIFGAVWRRGTVCCVRCMPQLHQLDPDEDGRCDRCGRISRPIYPGAGAIGALIVMWGLCRRCADETGVPVCSKERAAA